MTSLGSAAKRAFKVGRIAVAARTLKRAIDEESRERAARALSGLMADARGVPMKVGQLMASQSIDGPFQELVHSIDPIPLEQIVPILEDAWGRPLATVLKEFHPSKHAASIGQVHRATLLNGQEVAIKVRYPDISAAIDAEMRLAGLMPGVGPVKRWGFDLDGYRTTLRANLERELDYLNESDRQVQFAANNQIEGLVVPKVTRHLCRDGILVQRWEPGDRWSVATQWRPEARRTVATTLLHTLFSALFRGGEVHGDPHPGNYAFRGPGPQVVLFDYGCTIPVSARTRTSLLKLIQCTRSGIDDNLLAIFVDMGFDCEKLGEIRDDLPALARALFQPFVGDRDFDTASWNLSTELSSILGERRWWFRSAGPPELMLLMRAFQGITQQLEQLDIQLCWWKELCKIIPTETLAHARTYSPRQPTIRPHSRDPDVLPTAKDLCVRVMKGPKQLVRLKLPARAALDLVSLVPEDVRHALRREGTDLGRIQSRLTSTGLHPQEIFALDDGDKRYRIWLE